MKNKIFVSMSKAGQCVNLVSALSKAPFLALMIFGLLFISGCTSNSTTNDRSFRIVTTIFPTYDWVRELVGENIDSFDLSFLTDSGVDLHNFQPSVSDIARISSSDMFIYVGGHSDTWVSDVLNAATNPDMIIINLIDILDGIMEIHDHAHDHSHSHGHSSHSHSHSHDHDLCHILEDEHVWLSLNFAKYLTTAIAEGLSQLDPDNAYIYRRNLNSYIGELWVLNAEFEHSLVNADVDTVLFADRFPFFHLMRDYHLNHYAAFPGCSAETEASFTTIAFLIGRVNYLGLQTILVTETSDFSIARTIARDSEFDPQIRVLNSMQSVSRTDVENGASYLSIMRNNLAVLQEATGTPSS